LLCFSAAANSQQITETATPKTIDGHPAVLISGRSTIDGWDSASASIVERSGASGEPELLFHFVRTDQTCYGNLSVSAHHVRWSPACEKHPFDFAPEEIAFVSTSSNTFAFKAKGKLYEFAGGEKDKHLGSKESLCELLRGLFQQSVQDFGQALMNFERMRSEK
jgi:hypothetical protein